MLHISAARKGRRQQLDLNIAPLIDMVFILLIFFLVTTSFVKESGVDIDRPSAATAAVQEKAAIMIGVTKDNQIYMENRQIDIRAVRANVERALAENPEGTVVIVADKYSRTGVAIEVMDACRMAGAEAVSIAARLPGSSD